MAKQARLDFALSALEQLQLSYTATAGEGADHSTLNDKLKAQLDSFSIPSEASEVTHNMLIGAMLETKYRSASLT